jgi:hypothetical protein
MANLPLWQASRKLVTEERGDVRFKGSIGCEVAEVADAVGLPSKFGKLWEFDGTAVEQTKQTSRHTWNTSNFGAVFIGLILRLNQGGAGYKGLRSDQLSAVSRQLLRRLRIFARLIAEGWLLKAGAP